MASHAPHFGRASALPLSAVLGAIPSYPRPVIERLVSRLIERLDERDGDPDLEADPFNEGEPLFDAQSRARVNAFPETDPNNDAEPDGDENDCGDHWPDQRIADIGHGYAPWHIDEEMQL